MELMITPKALKNMLHNYVHTAYKYSQSQTTYA